MSTSVRSSVIHVAPPPALGRPLVRRLAAVAFLDVVGFSRLMGVDEDATLRDWLALQRTVIDPRAAKWRGRIAGRAGDGLLIEFPSALDASSWAIDVQQAIASDRVVGNALQVRIALHLGDVMDDADGQLQGDGVNTAARLQSYAEPGGIVMSQAVANEVAGKLGETLQDIGALRLKNIARPVRAFHMTPTLRTASGEASPGRRIASSALPRRRRLAAGVELTAAAAAAMLVLASVSVERWRSAGATAVAGLALPSPREQATRLFEAGRAVVCNEHPCPKAWLESRDLYEKAIAADPAFAPPYAYAALTYQMFIANDLSLNESADLAAAERLATRAASLEPEAAISHRARGAVLMMQPGRLQDALSAYQRSLAIDPEQPAVRANIGWLLIALGRPAEAEGYLARALADAPHDLFVPGWLTYLGMAELFLDRAGHGAGSFRRAMELQSPAEASGQIGLQRAMDLAAAQALNGELDDAHNTLADVKRAEPAVSIQSVWGCECSHAPGYLAGIDRLRHGLVLAGLSGQP